MRDAAWEDPPEDTPERDEDFGDESDWIRFEEWKEQWN